MIKIQIKYKNDTKVYYEFVDSLNLNLNEGELLIKVVGKENSVRDLRRIESIKVD
jgi:hypothetical protein